MKKKFHQILKWIRQRIKNVTPGNNAARGASLLLIIITSLLWLAFAFRFYLETKDPWLFVFFILMYFAVILVGFLVRWILKKINRINPRYLLSLLIALPLLIFMMFGPDLTGLTILVVSLLGAGYFVLRKTGFRNLTKTKKVLTVLGLLLGFSGIVAGGIFYGMKGFDMEEMVNAARESESNISKITAPSPIEIGPYTVKTLTYGSGNDLRREEFGAGVQLRTEAVDGLPFIDGWEGFSGWWREKYWGFTSDSLPINGRVWYPEGDGPFPLALIVHGNHMMQDFSDPGYDYLGELLASRGIILASVDENFINSSWSDIFGGLEAENDARGWLLLEHLKVWHEWNDDSAHEFYQKIDTSNLALMGHSRGGEAVAHAAMLNKLPYYPDDASVTLDYNYNIKSIVAIAPVDGQYEPGASRTKFEDVSYFVIHGAQDADVSSFMGSQQYERVKFTDSVYNFKSGLYVYGANHGQFNTSWGNNDTAAFTGFLNLKQLLSAEDQEKIANVYISSFLDITLKGKKEYLPLFIDARVASDWLPETLYLNQFEDSNLEVIAGFDEDFDVSTLTERSGELHAENLTIWREEEIELQWEEKGSRALVLGWNYEFESKEDSLETMDPSKFGRYQIKLDSMAVDSTSALVFTMAESDEKANPKSEGKWVKDKDEEEEEETEEDSEEKEDDKEDEVEAPIDFTIEITDTAGKKISFPLSDFSALQREIEVMIMKAGFISGDSQSEKVFQTFYFPLELLQKQDSIFDPYHISNIQFIFNKNDNGVVVIDNIGFMKSFDELINGEE